MTKIMKQQPNKGDINFLPDEVQPDTTCKHSRKGESYSIFCHNKPSRFKLLTK